MADRSGWKLCLSSSLLSCLRVRRVPVRFDKARDVAGSFWPLVLDCPFATAAVCVLDEPLRAPRVVAARPAGLTPRAVRLDPTLRVLLDAPRVPVPMLRAEDEGRFTVVRVEDTAERFVVRAVWFASFIRAREAVVVPLRMPELRVEGVATRAREAVVVPFRMPELRPAPALAGRAMPVAPPRGVTLLPAVVVLPAVGVRTAVVAPRRIPRPEEAGVRLAAPDWVATLDDVGTLRASLAARTA